MKVRRLGMNVRSVGRIMLLVLATAAIAVSCSYDYWLDLSISQIRILGQNVEVDYTMTNSGGKTMYNASIHIRVTADVVGAGLVKQDAWVPTDGTDLSSFKSYSDTAAFVFGNTINAATVEFIGSRWDDSSYSE